MQPHIETARSADAEDLFRLLKQNDLPVDGLRDHVPATVQASVEFTSACPSSATVLRKLL